MRMMQSAALCAPLVFNCRLISKQEHT
ncbi:protein of unknown function [Methylorubrum extorquens]|uniref:Uncharacterized protein n=1 Tax=Methylorubrum extorquens TaxID=408 RepID=A0A2N9AP12_METEX|nr:protein of unknown function [Methylorubrum extorquens]